MVRVIAPVAIVKAVAEPDKSGKKEGFKQTISTPSIILKYLWLALKSFAFNATFVPCCVYFFQFKASNPSIAKVGLSPQSKCG